VETPAEQRLVARARLGDIDAFEAMLEPAIPIGHRFACGLLHDASLAEDAVQEASVRAWRKLSHLRPDAPFLPWFLGIIARQCHDQIRGRWWGVVRQPQVDAPNAEPLEERSVRTAFVRAALRKLATREREVLLLRLYLDLSWSDVAAAAGLTEAGARTRYYRALDRLRPLLGVEVGRTQ
jgi:RNA polymerase sigma-70 factor (ECF subfamily)